MGIIKKKYHDSGEVKGTRPEPSPSRVPDQVIHVTLPEPPPGQIPTIEIVRSPDGVWSWSREGDTDHTFKTRRDCIADAQKNRALGERILWVREDGSIVGEIQHRER